MISSMRGGACLALLGLFTTLTLAACGGGTSDTGSSSGTSGSTSGTSGTTGGGVFSKEPAVHRAAAAACTVARPPGTDRGDAGGGSPGDCRSDAECTNGSNGRCQGTRIGYQCSYDGCADDTACGAASSCNCRTIEAAYAANECLRAGCHTDADCPGVAGGKGYCSPTVGSCSNYGYVGFECHTSSDECADDADCQGTEKGNGACGFDTSVSHWKCIYSMCAG